MFGSTVIDVAIGMIFVYLLLSLLCSAIKEYIEAKWLQYRSQNLWQGIQLLLNGEIREGLKKPDTRAAMPGVSSPPAAAPAEKLDIASLLYNHGLVRALYQDAERLPSYIPSRTFALALWNLASDATGGTDTRDLAQIKQAINDYIPNAALRQSLVTMIDAADNDFDRAVKNVEDWYDAAMDRVSGWYKRHTQFVLLAIGCATALFINADSVNIARALIQDKALREVLVADATDYLREHPANGGGADANTSNADNANRAGRTNNANAANTNASNANANSANTNSANANSANAGAGDAAAPAPTP
ncbi:MAG: hypothetical protein LC746_02595, partial [Acidobacteria bacterium]|nr:hypothetical protein [Acidobacteriota bacterium]